MNPIKILEEMDRLYSIHIDEKLKGEAKETCNNLFEIFYDTVKSELEKKGY